MRTNLHFSSLLLLLAACPGAGESPDAAVAFDCGERLGLDVRILGGTYVAIDAATGGAELVQGFQGFRYVYVRARLDVDPGTISAVARLELDGQSPRSQPIGQLAFSVEGSEVVSAPTQLFFNDDPLASLVDHGLTIELRLGDSCAASGATILRYDATCVEGPDGTPICEGGAR
jgi:hypothetical protein